MNVEEMSSSELSHHHQTLIERLSPAKVNSNQPMLDPDERRQLVDLNASICGELGRREKGSRPINGADLDPRELAEGLEAYAPEVATRIRESLAREAGEGSESGPDTRGAGGDEPEADKPMNLIDLADAITAEPPGVRRNIMEGRYQQELVKQSRKQAG